MGPHEVVNGAGGSVTWCQGPPFCALCNAARAVPFGPANFVPINIEHCPGCTCRQPIQRLIPVGTYPDTMVRITCL